MTIRGEKNFCTECRETTTYTLKRKDIAKEIKGHAYHFSVITAVCDNCGEEVNIPGIIDKNIKEVDEQYRAIKGLVSIEDIQKLMTLYDIGKRPLSLALGFGEVTIERYLSGQIPSKKYSDVIKKALTDPSYMKACLEENKDKLREIAFAKSMNAAQRYESLFSVSEKILGVISRLFANLEEITPLMLQKLLYYVQGLSYVKNGKSIFSEECQAWVHGPVYPEIYFMFRDFKYNPIEDVRFAIIQSDKERLTESEVCVVDLVSDTFGRYSGKILERITHREPPWVSARKGLTNDMRSNKIISSESIEAYFKEKDGEYGFSEKAGIETYICNMMD
ncbi:type II toxin-antitoxin system antitoxin SocA domain-containing protein [Peptococcus simiae]|uniref:Type II toxin-antitoxin system antitoxin SocA domain-containing protein n=1 Tax=Peptococcus simiae TaxID=1643805 RepID=A0ABW9H148_9FIRM